MAVANSEWRTANGIAGASGGNPLAIRHSPSAKDKTLKAAQDFESMFLEQMLDRVFASEGTEGPLGENGASGGIYRSMLVKEYAGGVVKAGGIGIASQIYREMLQLQEGADAGRR
jgi:Rod binding domain-containing protein